MVSEVSFALLVEHREVEWLAVGDSPLVILRLELGEFRGIGILLFAVGIRILLFLLYDFIAFFVILLGFLGDGLRFREHLVLDIFWLLDVQLRVGLKADNSLDLADVLFDREELIHKSEDHLVVDLCKILGIAKALQDHKLLIRSLLSNRLVDEFLDKLLVIVNWTVLVFHELVLDHQVFIELSLLHGFDEFLTHGCLHLNVFLYQLAN